MTLSQYFIQGEGKKETIEWILKDSEMNLKMNLHYVCILSISASSAYQLASLNSLIFKLCLLIHTFKIMNISQYYVDYIPHIIVISAFTFIHYKGYKL